MCPTSTPIARSPCTISTRATEFTPGHYLITTIRPNLEKLITKIGPDGNQIWDLLIQTVGPRYVVVKVLFLVFEGIFWI